jgi:hypothetical protein
VARRHHVQPLQRFGSSRAHFVEIFIRTGELRENRDQLMPTS